MRAILSTVSLVTLIAAGAAMAQTGPATSRPGGGMPGAATGPAAAPRIPAPNPLTMEDVSKLKGKAVYGSDDKKIGDVSTALMKPDSHTIDRLVVGAGGVVGVGARHVALPIDDFKWDGDKGGFRIAKSADELKSMPEWKDAAATTGSSTAPAGSSAPATAGGGAGAPKTAKP